MKQDTAKKSSRKKVIKTIFFFIFLAVFLFSGYKVLSILTEYQKAVNTYSDVEKLAVSAHKDTEKSSSVDMDAIVAEAITIPTPTRRISMDFDYLKEEASSEIVGWIFADWVNIDYPIVQHSDNDYYIERMYNGKANINGAIFMDYRNYPDYSDRNTVIYGHHMANGTMFGDLDKYKKQAYYDEHPIMLLYTPEGDFLVELFSGTIEDGNSEFLRFDFDSEEDFLSYVNGFRARSLFESDVEVNPGDRILSLCTCSYERSNGRYLVMGRLVPLYE